MATQWRPQGMVTGIGSLPHRDASAAAAFSLASADLPAIPTLPRRSPAEGMISQAVAGMRGFTIGQYGSIAVDVDAVDPDDPASSQLHDDAYAGLFAFLDEAAERRYQGPVKWQFVGPVTLKQGWNRVLIKVRNGVSAYGWSLRFANADRSALGNCTFALTASTAPTNPTSCTDASGTTDNSSSLIILPSS